VFEGRIYVYASHDPDDQMAYDMTDYHVFSSDDLCLKFTGTGTAELFNVDHFPFE
jgi:hypothetical protein